MFESQREEKFEIDLMVRMKIQVSSSSLFWKAGEREREKGKWEKVLGKNEKKIVLFLFLVLSLFFPLLIMETIFYSIYFSCLSLTFLRFEISIIF